MNKSKLQQLRNEINEEQAVIEAQIDALIERGNVNWDEVDTLLDEKRELENKYIAANLKYAGMVYENRC